MIGHVLAGGVVIVADSLQAAAHLGVFVLATKVHHFALLGHSTDPMITEDGGDGELQQQDRFTDRAFAGEQRNIGGRYPARDGPAARRNRLLGLFGRDKLNGLSGLLWPFGRAALLPWAPQRTFS
jgi:hypothetical protein